MFIVYAYVTVCVYVFDCIVGRKGINKETIWRLFVYTVTIENKPFSFYTALSNNLGTLGKGGAASGDLYQ